MSTDAIQTAINDAHQAGGGTAYVPEGLFMLDSSIMLKSNVELYLAGGAVLRSTADPSKFNTFYHKNSLGDGTWLIYTEGYSENIKIYGRGTIDGNGFRMKQDHDYYANIVIPMQCSGFTMDGVVIIDGNMWSVTPTRCDNVVIRNTKHFNENHILRENDAIDIVECQDVLVEHTIAISEDDSYSTKTWGTASQTDIVTEYWPGSPEELNHVVFDDCTAWSRCGAFKVGDGNFQAQRNVTYKNSYVFRSMSALKLTHGYGYAVTENIVFDNIYIEDFYPSQHYDSTERWLDFYQSSDGHIRNVTVRNIDIRYAGKTNSRLTGRSSTYFYDNVTLENIYMPGSDVSASSLSEMNVRDTNSFVKNLKIYPYQDPGRIPRENLASRKPVKASNEDSTNRAANVVDGDESTRWSGTKEDSLWIRVDLGA